MRPFHLEIVTPDGVSFEGECESLLVRTDDGDVEILAGHADLIATVAVGRVRLLSGGETRFAAASGGFLSVSKDGVRLVTTTFEFSEDIDLARAEAAKEKAEAKLLNAKNDRDVLVLKAKLARAISRINVAGK